MSEQKKLDRPEPRECPHCLGTGHSGSKVMGSHTDCPYCQGAGKTKARDRPDREKIIKRIKAHFGAEGFVSQAHYEAHVGFLADQYQALIPDTEEPEWVGARHLNLDSELEEAKREERERIINEVFPQDIYPAHLKSWAKTIEREQGYHSTMTAFLDYLAVKWQALKGEK